MTTLELPVCILGMGRSGTSLTARVLNLLGVDLGPESGFVERSEQNVTGYWERRAKRDGAGRLDDLGPE